MILQFMGSRELDVNSGTLSADWAMDLLKKGVFQVERYEAQARYDARSSFNPKLVTS